MISSLIKVIDRYSLYHHLIASFMIRLSLILISNIKLFGVSYTDIDYVIFTDGSRMIKESRSPYERETYRYTPLLAMMMLPNITLWPSFGKLLFAFLDIISGMLMYLIMRNLKVSKNRATIFTAFGWLYNPLPAIISTRGSAESVMTTLVLLTIWLLVTERWSMSGVFYGLAIHFKIYPIIYSPAIYLTLVKSDKLYKAFIPNGKRMKFFISAMISFFAPTLWSYYKYGDIYVEESWIYHLKRKDPQHNFSPYFYIYHLTKDEEMQKMLSFAAFIPQMLTIVAFALIYGISRKNKTQDLCFAMFCQTSAFVTLNKVITSQYFLWYLCLLPLVAHRMIISRSEWIAIIVIWLLAQGQWLLPAYLYEIQQWKGCLLWVWIGSCVFVLCNMIILMFMVFRYKSDKIKKK